MSIIYNKLKVGGINPSSLHKEISNSIATILEYVSVEDESLDDFILSFETQLTTQEEADLDIIISNHDKIIKKFKQSGKSTINESQNLNLLGYYVEEIIDSKGSLIEKNYYKSYDGTTYSDLVAKDSFVYNILPNDLVLYRDETIEWYYEDGSPGHTKTIKKWYIKGTDAHDAIIEGQTRRHNIVTKTKSYGFYAIKGTNQGPPVISNAIHFMKLLEELNLIQSYIDGVKDPLIDFITNTTEQYMTQTIKDTLISILKYW